MVGGWWEQESKGQDLLGHPLVVQDFFHQPYPLKVKGWKMIHFLLIWSLFGGLTFIFRGVYLVTSTAGCPAHHPNSRL